MLKSLVIVAGALLAPAAIYLAAGGLEVAEVANSRALAIPELSADAYQGRRSFAAACASCHGSYGEGSENGPTLLHMLYAPGRMSDEHIANVIANGAEARHWPFGNMPAVAGLTPQRVDDIIIFMREMQFANNIR